MFDIMYMMYSEKIRSAQKVVVTGRTISKLYDELAARKLLLNGHENVYILDGGLNAWKKKGLPTEP
jgi:3-mercaptopyruvate sulfurtransferase SseA